MRKVNKNITRIVAILLALVMLSACALSGTLAKYVTNKDRAVEVGITPFGVTIKPGTDLHGEKSEDGAVTYNWSYDTDAKAGIVEIKANTAGTPLIAPGTRGALAYFEVTSTDVPWYIDINGEISIGDGYKASSGLILDENGKPIDYFPIIIYLYRYDWNGSKYVESTAKPVKVAHCVVRLTPDAPKTMTPTKPTGEDKNWDVLYRLSYFEADKNSTTSNPQMSGRWGTISSMVTNAGSENSTDKRSLNVAFDHNTGAGNAAGTKSIFVVEWCWPYDSTSSFKQKNNSYATKTRTDGTEYTYQTRELDAQIGEAMIKKPELFNISLDLSAKVYQAPNS
jgi:hypothetical protein